MDALEMDIFKEFLDTGEGNGLSPLDIPEREPGNELGILKPEIQSNFPEFEGKEVVVFGDSLRTGEQLDHMQGDNPYLARGNCGLVSAANFLNMCGVSAADEKMITKYAIDHNLCKHGWFVSSADRGGVTLENIQNILQDFGIETQAYEAFDVGGSIENIASRLETGYVGTMGVNAGHLWDNPAYIGDGSANHEVTLTGTVRDLETGELLGLTVCDSGDGKACDVLTVEELKACYERTPAAHVVFSTVPLRQEI